MRIAFKFIAVLIFVVIQNVLNAQSQSLVDSIINAQDNFYQEIGIPKEIVDQMRPDQVMELIEERGAFLGIPREVLLAMSPEQVHSMYTDYLSAKTNKINRLHGGESGPPEKMIVLVIALITLGLIAIVAMLLWFSLKVKKEKYDLIYKAIDEKVEIPEALFQFSHPKVYNSIGLILFFFGLGLSFYSYYWSGNWTTGVIPVLTAVGCFFSARA